MVKQIREKDGRLVAFEGQRILNVINKILSDQDKALIETVYLDIFKLLNAKSGQVVDAWTYEEVLLEVLSKTNQLAADKYGKMIKEENNKISSKNTKLDYKAVVEDYLKVSDWRVKENSTVNYSLGGLILNNSGAISANYWLSEIYDKEVANAHRSAAIHIHDLSMLSAYCAGWDLERIIKEGVGGVESKISSHPAKHLQTLSNQLVNFLGIMANEWAGAQAFSSFDTYLAPFIRADNLTYRETKQAIQSFVFGVNTPGRWGCQAPFSNITLDWTVPADLAKRNVIVGGKELDFKYEDCQKEMDMINKAFLEVMLEGDANGRGFQYPIPTYSLTRDFDWADSPNNRLLFEMTAKYGTPYFSNYINSDMEPSDVRSMCCRLRLDLRELRKKSGGYFGSGSNTGSVGVITINMPRIAYLSKDKADFYKQLDDLMDLSARSLKTKREVVTKFLDDGLFPYTKRYLGHFNNHFSTIGLVGMNEACLNANWIKKDLTNIEAQDFTEEVLNHMRNKLSDYQEKYGDLYNLEATPAESTAYRLAKHDVKNFKDIITAKTNSEVPYYTNSSHLPVGHTSSISEALEIQDRLQVLYTSGTVFHGFLGQKLQNWNIAASVVRKIAENYKLPYFTMSPTYSICKEHGYIAGEHFNCPTCGKQTEVYSRITGYYRPIQNWNDGKRAEYFERKEYILEEDKIEGLTVQTHVEETKTGVDIASNNAKYMLFTTTTCPNCVYAKRALDEKDIKYELIYADKDIDMARKYKISTVPTLLVVKGSENELLTNYANIAKYASRQ